jgi:hypothetical protein
MGKSIGGQFTPIFAVAATKIQLTIQYCLRLNSDYVIISILLSKDLVLYSDFS